jgi:glycerophosphoryl diester phosphodiesterase
MKSKYSYLKPAPPHLLAHRGGDEAGINQQNTLAAFKSAVGMGYKYIETDVVLSKDGKVVIYHGSRSRRQQRKTGLHRRKILQNMTYAEIKKLFSPTGIDIPLLEDALHQFPDTFFNIDAKTDEVVAPLAKIIKKAKAVDRICAASFKYKRTLGVANLLGGQDRVCTSVGPLGFSHYLLHTKTPRAFKKKLDSLAVGCLQIPHRLVSKELLREAHKRGVMVHAWTVNDPAGIKRMLRLGVDGIVSDKIKTLHNLAIDNSGNSQVS